MTTPPSPSPVLVCDVAALGAWLAGERMARAWSLDTLAALSGLSKGAVTGLESGTRGVPEIVTVLRLAAAFGRTPAQVLRILLPDVALDAPRGGLPAGVVEVLVTPATLSTLPVPEPAEEP